MKPLRLRAMAADHDVVAHGHAAEQRQVLEGAADAERGHAMARLIEQRVAVEGDACRRRGRKGG